MNANPERLDAPRRRRRHSRTSSPFVALDRSLCEACWCCAAVCPEAVLGKVEFLKHRHVVVDFGERCTGCGRCLKACKSGALLRSLPRLEAGAVGSVAGRSHWFQATILYVLVGMSQVYGYLLQGSDRVISVAGRPWSTTDIHETSVVVFLFTMLFVGFLARIRILQDG